MFRLFEYRRRTLRMKRFVMLLLIAVLFMGCHRISPDNGQEAVLISKPYLFGSGGILDTPIKTGSQFTWNSTEPIMVNMLPQQHTIHFEDLMTSDGVPMDFDAMARVQVQNSVDLISKFGNDWWNNNVVAELKERVRQAVRKHGMNETAIKPVAIEEIDNEVTKAMETYIKSINLPVNLIAFTVGKANPPDSIESQRVETAAQEQRINTELQRKKAEDSRLAAETSRAAADNAYRQSMSLSPEQYVALESVKVEAARVNAIREVCKDKNCTFIMGNATPVIGR